jgi:formylmethanofuran dehydrogenase subunit C
MPLTLRLRQTTPVPIEVEGIVPDRLRDKSVAEIEKITIYHGNRELALAEFFRVSGDLSDARIDFEGDLAGVHSIGYGMNAGEVRVHGSAGRHVGALMGGGRITIDGDAGDYAGCEMRGGLIHVAGSAANRIGAAYPGSKKGMTDGTILIGGDVGGEVGASMRRGTVVVGGSCADAPGFNMIAGSILVFGSCGVRPGAGMRRGTIGLLGTKPPTLLPTFRPAGRFRPLFLRLLFRELTLLGFPIDAGLIDAELFLSHGDLVELGKGEIWMKAN